VGVAAGTFGGFPLLHPEFRFLGRVILRSRKVSLAIRGETKFGANDFPGVPVRKSRLRAGYQSARCGAVRDATPCVGDTGIPRIRLILHRQPSRSAKPESVRLSFEESFAKPRSLPTFRTSSSEKTFQTKPYDFQSEPAPISLDWEREQF
jgi:hypothetical protein